MVSLRYLIQIKGHNTHYNVPLNKKFNDIFKEKYELDKNINDNDCFFMELLTEKVT